MSAKLLNNDLAQMAQRQRREQAECKTCLDHGYLDEWWSEYPPCPDCNLDAALAWLLGGLLLSSVRGK